MTMKTCYIYDAETGELLGAEDVMESPLEPGKYLAPDFATFEVPPEPVKGGTPVWDGAVWTIVPDYRGYVFWDTMTKEEVRITRLGDRPHIGWTNIEPIDPECEWTDAGWVVSLDVLKMHKIGRIRDAADAAMDALHAGFSRAEVESWGRQAAGAKDLAADAGADTPEARFVRSVAQARDVPVDRLVAKILKYADAYADSLARIVGRQQRLEDSARAATTEKELAGVPESIV